MCDTCGCGHSHDQVKIQKPGSTNHVHPHSNSHSHPHSHSHSHPHSHSHSQAETSISVEQDLLGENQRLAERNRLFFMARGITAFNLVSSPGSGKTTLLERTLRELQKEIGFYIVEGDQQTLRDADRIHALDIPVVQVNTGDGCHLDAAMIWQAVDELQPAEGSVLMIENVGNLVCPALFDLGETQRIVIMSVTEGDDKPLKYPNMFHTSQLCLINKTDLLPYVDFDLGKARSHALEVNHHLEFLEVSARTGEGMEQWYSWLRSQTKKK